MATAEPKVASRIPDGWHSQPRDVGVGSPRMAHALLCSEHTLVSGRPRAARRRRESAVTVARLLSKPHELGYEIASRRRFGAVLYLANACIRASKHSHTFPRAKFLREAGRAEEQDSARRPARLLFACPTTIPFHLLGVRWHASTCCMPQGRCMLSNG